jgi:hypothetical protein
MHAQGPSGRTAATPTPSEYTPLSPEQRLGRPERGALPQQCAATDLSVASEEPIGPGGKVSYAAYQRGYRSPQWT